MTRYDSCSKTNSDQEVPKARAHLHIDPQTKIDYGFLHCKSAHGLAKHLRARVDGLFGFEDA
jgi:hypothetical protein